MTSLVLGLTGNDYNLISTVLTWGIEIECNPVPWRVTPVNHHDWLIHQIPGDNRLEGYSC
jgi:hypothetical protein